MWSKLSWVIALSVLSAPSRADTNHEFAEQLGNLIASQDACEFQIDQDAVQKAIIKNVSEGDLEFPDALEINIWSQKRDLEGMDNLRLKLHCQQILRAGRKRGYVKGRQ